MNWKQDMPYWLRAILRKRQLDIDMADEMRCHIEMQTRENLEAGMPPEEARCAAFRQFGPVEAIKETCRDQRGFLWPEQFLQDVHYGLRKLRKSPGFTAAAVATLGLGIGINTAIFSIISAVLLRPLPFPDSHQLVQLNTILRNTEGGVSVPDYRDWRAASRSFARLGTYCYYADFRLTEGDQTRPLRGVYASAEMLPAVGVAPLLGRGLLEEDEKAGGVAVVGYDLWCRLFGSENSVMGKSLMVNTQRVDIVGVMPQGFNFPNRTELWMPLPAMNKDDFRLNRMAKIWEVIGRLKPAVSLAQAQAEMDSVARNLEAQYPDFNRALGIRVASFQGKLNAPIRPALPFLIAVAMFILLIACANLGNLLLSRCLTREKELAIRSAVGADNGRLIRQLMTESLLLSLLGAAAGLVAVVWTRSVWSAWVGPHLPRFALIQIDSTVWWFTLAAAIVTGLVCGLVPAWRIWRGNLHEKLKQGGQRAVSDHSIGWLRSSLVVVQVSLALVLLIGAGLALRSVYYLLHPGLEVDARKVFLVEVDLPKERYSAEAARLDFFEQAIARLQAWPMVQAVAAATQVTFRPGGAVSETVLEDRPDVADASTRLTRVFSVTPGYFAALGVPLLRGRDLDPQDRKGGLDVAVINATMARRYWPGEDPLGKRFAPRNGQTHAPWITVVGVVADLQGGGVESEHRPEYYRPWYQFSYLKTLVLRTMKDAPLMPSQVQSLFRDLDKGVTTPTVETLDHLLHDVADDARILATLLAAFAGLALVLAVVGIYGVIAYTVTQRSHEFGVRMALGAQKGQLILLVLKWGLRMALAGTALGLILAWMSSRLMASLVHGVTPRDTLTYLAVPWLLFASAFLACYLPAHKAAQVDPMSALRND